eukprot:scaffold2303_cov113-Isochrysis_galbana.AAC.2
MQEALPFPRQNAPLPRAQPLLQRTPEVARYMYDGAANNNSPITVTNVQSDGRPLALPRDTHGSSGLTTTSRTSTAS